MKPVSPNDGEQLCRDILNEAQTEANRVLTRARQEADTLLATTRAAGEKTRQELLIKIQQECARRRENMRASLAIDCARLCAARIESLLNLIHDDIRDRLQRKDGFDYGKTLVALATSAIDRMEGSEFQVAISPGETDLGDSLAAAILRHSRKTGITIRVVYDPAISDTGLIVRDHTGRQEWDNRLTARLERFWPELRLKLAAFIPEAVKDEEKGDSPHASLTHTP